MHVIPVGSTTTVPPVLFELDFTTQSLGGGSLASYLLSFARAAGPATVPTSASTYVQGIGVDTPRFGNDGTHFGLLIEESRKNWLAWSDDLTQAGYFTNASSNFTGTFGQTDPSGGSGYTRLHVTAAAGNSRFIAAVGGPAVNSFYSCWQKGTSAPGFHSWYNGIAMKDATTTSFARVAHTRGTSATPLIPQDCTDNGSDGPEDVVAGGFQIENGVFPTSLVPTAGAVATRAGERVFDSSPSRWVDQGQLSIEILMQPISSATGFTTNPRIFTIDANNYVEFDKSTRKVLTTVGGVTDTSGTACVGYSVGDTMKFFFAAGGGRYPTYSAYQQNAGAATKMSTGSPATFGALSPTTLDLFCNGTSAQFSSYVQKIRAYRSGTKPSWTP